MDVTTTHTTPSSSSPLQNITGPSSSSSPLQNITTPSSSSPLKPEEKVRKLKDGQDTSKRYTTKDARKKKDANRNMNSQAGTKTGKCTSLFRN